MGPGFRGTQTAYGGSGAIRKAGSVGTMPPLPAFATQNTFMRVNHSDIESTISDAIFILTMIEQKSASSYCLKSNKCLS